MIVKRIDLFILQSALNSLTLSDGVNICAYKSKLLSIINAEIGHLRAFMSTPEWKRVNRLIGDIKKKYSDRVDDSDKMNAEIELLKESEKEAFIIREKLALEYTELLNAEIDIDFNSINISLTQNELAKIIIAIAKTPQNA